MGRGPEEGGSRAHMTIELRSSQAKITSSVLALCLTLLFARMIGRPWATGCTVPTLPHDPELLRVWRSHPEHPQCQHQYMDGIRQYSMSLHDYPEASKQYRMPIRENLLSSEG